MVETKSVKRAKKSASCYKRKLDLKKHQNCNKARTEAHVHCYGTIETAVKADCEETQLQDTGGKALTRTALSADLN